MSARLLVGDAIPFDFRLLSPFILLAEAGIVVVLSSFLSRSRMAVRRATLAIAALWLAGSARVSGRNAYDAVTDGSDFAQAEWRSSPTLEWVKTKSTGWTLFSNWPPAIYFGTTRIARDIPQSLDTADLREFRDILRKRHGAFVAFESYNTDYPPSDSLANALGLVEAAHFPDGKVWVSRANEVK